MQKICALLLLLMTAWLLVAPIALAGPGQAQLPACCRRGGVHHCAGAPIEADRATASLHGTPCMLMPHAALALLQHNGLAPAALTIPFQPSASGFVSTSALEGYAYTLALKAPRGPPPSLAFHG